MSNTYIKNNITFRHNTWDENIWNTIYYHNEYGLSHDELHWIGDVIDIGAHIGSFSRLMYDHTTQDSKIFAVEANIDNFNILKSNLDIGIANNRIFIYNKCINFSDNPCYQIYDPGYNTGGIRFSSDQKYILTYGEKIESINLDDLIDMARHPILMKIDCEGCEFDIIKNSNKIIKVKHIVGEFHAENPNDLKNFFENNNFSFVSHFHSASLGLFAAHNMTMA